MEKNVVAFATDSIARTKRIDGLDSRVLGDMKLDKAADDVIYLSNGAAVAPCNLLFSTNIFALLSIKQRELKYCQA